MNGFLKNSTSIDPNIWDFNSLSGYGSNVSNINLPTFGKNLSAVQPILGFNGGNVYDINTTPAAPVKPDFLSLEGFFGNGENKGWGGTAMGILQGLGGIYNGMRQYGLAKDTLAENKRQFELNYGAQRNTINSAMEDRQNARLAANGGKGYSSTEDYMSKWGIK